MRDFYGRVFDTFSNISVILAPSVGVSPKRYTRFAGQVVCFTDELEGRPLAVRSGRPPGDALMVLTGVPQRKKPLALCCSPRLPPFVYAGAETAMMGLCLALERRGFDVVAVEGEGPPGLSSMGGIALRSGFPRWETKYTKALLRKLKPDIIVAQFEAVIPFMEHAAGTPVYAYAHVPWSYHLPAERGLAPDGWIFTSYALWDACGRPQDSLVFHPVIDRMRVCGWRGRRKNVTMVNPSWAKGGDVVLALSHAFPEEHFALVRGGYGDIVEGLSARPNVEIIGPLRDMRPFYGNSKLHLVPSREETYGMAAAEARMAGAPVVASDLPGLHEALPDLARYAPPGDADAWVRVVGEALRGDCVAAPATKHFAQQARQDVWALENWWMNRHQIGSNLGDPKVTVMMMSHNRPNFIRQAISGIQQQSLRDWELIIIDDSTDPDVLKILRRVQLQDPRVRVVYHETGNLSWKRNQVLRLARAPIIANNDDDDISDPMRLEVTVRAFRADPKLGIFWGFAHLIDAEGERCGTHRWHAAGMSMESAGRLKVHSGSAAFRTEWAREVMYDEEWSTGTRWRPGHDYDFYFRYLQNHPKVANYDGYLCSYRVVGPRVSSGKSW
jgi:glycosyltransferase involved in cell wall biosynthesis